MVRFRVECWRSTVDPQTVLFVCLCVCVRSNYQSGSVRHGPSLDSISSTVDGVQLQVKRTKTFHSLLSDTAPFLPFSFWLALIKVFLMKSGPWMYVVFKNTLTLHTTGRTWHRPQIRRRKQSREWTVNPAPKHLLWPRRENKSHVSVWEGTRMYTHTHTQKQKSFQKNEP